MSPQLKEKILAVMQYGVDRDESTGFFRVALGLYYLAGLMTKETLDFAELDADFNRFIYHAIGRGHSITSVLQYMSGEKVVRVVESKRFLKAFAEHCDEVPVENIPFLLGLNLGVAKDISKIDVRGPVADYIERQRQLREAADAK
ncbi:hypothetical protein GTP55_02525 [Duganella sp. FT109W]|jgi:hypothetical protein|uniref:Uncharacterized protein n=1 Tax=Duganella margarita TaxID=2692170 RepID=A0A7X4KDU9_9BURK|nr:hypothetical protein [Duganella margarita]MYM70626.1 hypothetical protein [Duganella margarita]MYN38238.1 hypothetical protein [Duganella margarita]